MSVKDKLRGNSRTNIFVRVMVSFLLIILVPTMIMGIVWYRDIREKNHGDMMEKERRSLAEVQEAYRRIVSSVEQDLVGMVYGTSFQNYVATKKPEHMVQVMAEAARAVNRNESLYSVYLCDLGAGKIWDSGSKQQSLESFYDTNWLERRRQSVSTQWLPIRQNMDTDFYDRTVLNGMALFYPVKNVLTVITPQNMNAMFVGNIDMEAVGKEFAVQFDSTGKQVCLFLGKEVLYDSLAGAEELAGIGDLDWKSQEGFYAARGEERYYFACILDDHAGGGSAVEEEAAEGNIPGTSTFPGSVLQGGNLYYVESIPLEVIYSSSIGYGAYIVRVGGIVLAVMVFLAFLMAARIYRPLDELYNVVSAYQKKAGKADPEGDPSRIIREADGDAIKKAFSHMKNAKKTETDARILDAFVSAAKLRMLFDGILSQKHFFQETAAIFGPGEKKQCSLLLCRLRENLEHGEREARNRRLQETLDVYLMARMEGILSETSTGDFAVLFSGNTKEEIWRSEQFLVRIFNELTGDDNCFASSGAFSVEESVQEQYRLCRISLENEAFFPKRENGGGLVYPLSEENYSYKSMLAYAPSLIRAIVTGETRSLSEKLAELQEEICTVGRKDYAQNLCARILGEIDKELVLEPLEGSRGDLLREVYEMQPLDRLMSYMQQILSRRLETMNNQESHQQENRYYRDAIAYIQENYWKNINVTEVAEAIGISYVYLNKIFKAHHGKDEKLIDYLNRIRIQKATELLLQTDEILTVIAQKVGYNNDQSFSRFFKKYKGLTPGEWKRKYRGLTCNGQDGMVQDADGRDVEEDFL